MTSKTKNYVSNIILQLNCIKADQAGDNPNFQFARRPFAMRHIATDVTEKWRSPSINLTGVLSFEELRNGLTYYIAGTDH